MILRQKFKKIVLCRYLYFLLQKLLDSLFNKTYLKIRKFKLFFYCPVITFLKVIEKSFCRWLKFELFKSLSKKEF